MNLVLSRLNFEIPLFVVIQKKEKSNLDMVSFLLFNNIKSLAVFTYGG